MEIALFDIIGITFFLAVAYFIYKKAWFFSFYSFFKFLVVFISSFIAGLIIAPKISHTLPITTLQLSLVVEGILFIFLWKMVSFKRIFFTITDGIIPINRFVFTHHIDRILNILPSIIVAFFFSFFVFNIILAASTGNPALQQAIESSNIVKPLAYKIYFASVNAGNNRLFEGVAFNIVPTTSFSVPEIEREQFQPTPAPTVPPGGSRTFTPYIAPTTYVPLPTSTPIPTLTPIPIQAAPTPTQAPAQNRNESFFDIFIPNSPTPTVLPPTTVPTQFIPQEQPVETPIPTIAIPTQLPVNPIQQIFQPPPINIGTYEQDIFRLTNEQRVKNGLAPFVGSDQLASVARAHSQDMNDRNFFSHINPDGADPFTRMRSGGIPFSTGAENIAGGATADIIVSMWMNSPGHRANILNPTFTKLGVGAATNSQYGVLATQVFTN